MMQTDCFAAAMTKTPPRRKMEFPMRSPQRKPNQEASMIRTAVLFAVPALLMGAAVAHHGWGSYDAEKPFTVSGPIVTSKFENPHATLTVRGSDKTWTVTLAPTARMNSRGATAKVVAVGNMVSAYGYPSTVQKDEMRAERITVDGKTYEMR
jgi:hypothetical protein